MSQFQAGPSPTGPNSRKFFLSGRTFSFRAQRKCETQPLGQKIKPKPYPWAIILKIQKNNENDYSKINQDDPWMT